MKKVFGTLAFLSFVFLFGTVSAIEQNMMAFGTGIIRMISGLGGMWVFMWLAGGFEPYAYDEESRPRNGTPKGGKC